jgi:hypothetical protein
MVKVVKAFLNIFVAKVSKMHTLWTILYDSVRTETLLQDYISQLAK